MASRIWAQPRCTYCSCLSSYAGHGAPDVRTGALQQKAAAFASLGFLAVYLPVFWNHVPVVLAHRSMCARDAGFQIRVQPAQWIAQNRDKLISASFAEPDKTSEAKQLSDGYYRSTYFAGLLASETGSTRQEVLGIAIERTEVRIRDVQTSSVLATLVNYQLGGRDDVRPWFAGNTCYGHGDDGAPWPQLIEFHRRLKAGANWCRPTSFQSLLI